MPIILYQVAMGGAAIAAASSIIWFMFIFGEIAAGILAIISLYTLQKDPSLTVFCIWFSIVFAVLAIICCLISSAEYPAWIISFFALIPAIFSKLILKKRSKYLDNSAED